jgi:hypothetical protein
MATLSDRVEILRPGESTDERVIVVEIDPPRSWIIIKNPTRCICGNLCGIFT